MNAGPSRFCHPKLEASATFLQLSKEHNIQGWANTFAHAVLFRFIFKSQDHYFIQPTGMIRNFPFESAWARPTLHFAQPARLSLFFYLFFCHNIKSGIITKLALSQYCNKPFSGSKTVTLISMLFNLPHFNRTKSKGISPNSNANTEDANDLSGPL